MQLKITVLPGDGIGPEVTREAVRILEQVCDLCGHDLKLVECPVGGAAIGQTGHPLPTTTLDACLQCDAVLLGAVGGPEFDSLPISQRPEAGLLSLRTALGGFANLRAAKVYPAIRGCSPLRPEVLGDADVLVVRELLGGLYFSDPRGFSDDVASPSAFNTMRYSRDEIERIAHVAFIAARERRNKVTSVDKANVLETSRLWRQVVSEVAKQYPDVSLEHMYVDACAMHLMMSPQRFDVLLTENLFGDILSDEAAVLSGSLGMLASAAIGGVVDLYEPVHGSAPDIAGRGIANPLGAIASVAMLLRYSAGLPRWADDVEAAISRVLDDGYRTPDILCNGSEKLCTTQQMGEQVSSALVEVTELKHCYHAI